MRYEGRIFRSNFKFEICSSITKKWITSAMMWYLNRRSDKLFFVTTVCINYMYYSYIVYTGFYFYINNGMSKIYKCILNANKCKHNVIDGLTMHACKRLSHINNFTGETFINSTAMCDKVNTCFYKAARIHGRKIIFCVQYVIRK